MREKNILDYRVMSFVLHLLSWLRKLAQQDLSNHNLNEEVFFLANQMIRKRFQGLHPVAILVLSRD